MESRRKLSNGIQEVDENPSPPISPARMTDSLVGDSMRQGIRNKKLPHRPGDAQHVGGQKFLTGQSILLYSHALRFASRNPAAGIAVSSLTSENRVKSYSYRRNEGRRSVRYPGLLAVAILLSSFGVVALTTRALDVARNTEQLLDNQRLSSQLRHFKQENQDLRQTLQRVGDRLSSLELLAEEVQGLSRFAPGRGRNGGPSQVYFSRLTFSEDGDVPLPAQSEAFRSLFENAGRQIDDLAQHYRYRYFRLSHTPSTWPVDGILRDRFGFIRNRFGPGQSRFHQGIDISTRPGSRVMASADGMVHSTSWRSHYGKTVILKHHFGLSTVYAHLSAYNVKPGDMVQRGQVIGFVGNTGRSTGPHLHYEVRIGDMPVNPLRYLSNQARVTLPKLGRINSAVAR